MAKRELQEINAGSMADIAFLLLVFFLVTTTVEMEAGISRTLPVKLDNTKLPPPPPVNARNIFSIQVNSQDALRVENQPILLEELEEKTRDFYLANAVAETNPELAKYNPVSRQTVNAEMTEVMKNIENSTGAFKAVFEGEKRKLEKKLLVLDVVGNSYMEIDKTAVIQLKNNAGTSYGMYIQIQDVLKKVIEDLRREKAEELGWTYSEIDWSKEASEEDQKKAEVLKVLVPERIIESKIK
ncbi:MAG: biopolymer transporter ExbD [Crocinitomicaceae bacterium]|nr:biopolymer transporter ExbD [Crocinitomicaceae bacterium]